MNSEQTILNVIRELSTEKQEALLAHARKLQSDSGTTKAPRISGRGLWAGLNIQLSAEDIEEARREMWKSFPREDF